MRGAYVLMPNLAFAESLDQLGGAQDEDFRKQVEEFWRRAHRALRPRRGPARGVPRRAARGLPRAQRRRGCVVRPVRRQRTANSTSTGCPSTCPGRTTIAARRPCCMDTFPHRMRSGSTGRCASTPVWCSAGSGLDRHVRKRAGLARARPATSASRQPVKPLLPAEDLPPAAESQRESDVLDLSDVLGTRVIEMQHHGRLSVRPEQAAAALEVMSRFVVDPRWLLYLPPTMSPSSTSSVDGRAGAPGGGLHRRRTACRRSVWVRRSRWDCGLCGR